MVNYIAHRQNKLVKLQNLKKLSFCGIELDLRTFSNNIILQHDPFKKGLNFFSNYKLLKNFFLIIDIKSSGISQRIINFLRKKKANFLILNLSSPELMEMINKKFQKNLFLRYSFFENIDLKEKKFKKVNWVWVDFLNNNPITLKDYKYFKKNKKKICLTSPDLAGLKKRYIKNYIFHLNKNKIKADMVCVKQKNLKIWKKYYKY
tara:strand:+ start:117 stop:731 length:615 start_codon:yes stop_codon:yes gene_type:complete